MNKRLLALGLAACGGLVVIASLMLLVELISADGVSNVAKYASLVLALASLTALISLVWLIVTAARESAKHRRWFAAYLADQAKVDEERDASIRAEIDRVARRASRDAASAADISRDLQQDLEARFGDVLDLLEGAVTLPGPIASLERFSARRRRTSAELNTRRSGGRRVSVIMTTFRSSAFVAEAVQSVLDQTYTNVELIVVDDGSDDGTAEHVSEIAARDGRIRLIRCRRNRGTYWAKNLGMLHATGEYVAFQDSDDVSALTRLEKQVAALEGDPAAVACTAYYVRVDADGGVVLNQGQRRRTGFITMLMKKAEVLDRVGFFDSVRAAADNEYDRRIRRVFGGGAIVHVPETLYIAPLRDGSLSVASVGLEPAAGGGELGHLSPSRRQYYTAFNEWHATGRQFYVAFPPKGRPFPAPSDLTIKEAVTASKVTASLVAGHSSYTALRRVVAALEPQVDELRVLLCGTEEIPDFLRTPKVRVRCEPVATEIDARSALRELSHSDAGYHLMLDESIRYPPDYVAFVVAKLQQYAYSAIIGFGGRRSSAPESLAVPFVLDVDHAVAEDMVVDVLDLKTIAYHSSYLTLEPGGLPTRAAALADPTAEGAAPQIVVARPPGFLGR